MKTSSFGKLNWFDAAKGLFVAACTSALTTAVKVLENGSMLSSADLKSIGIIALASAGGYLLKNLFSNSDGQPLKKEEA